MPANIAHILIAQKACNEIKSTNHELYDLITNKNQHFYLGSLGPDLPSYKTFNLVKTAFTQYLVRPFVSDSSPQEQDASFFLHSIRPNTFPFYLIETNLENTSIENGKMIVDDFNTAMYVFTLGYVTHIAADQIIHRLVTELVGPYYKSKETSEKHSKCEVYQDIFLVMTLLKPQNLRTRLPSEIININKFNFDYDRFCNLFSLTLSKAGYGKMKRSLISDWIEGMDFAFRNMYKLGPLVNAIEYYEMNKAHIKSTGYYKLYFENPTTQLDYMNYFKRAVKLSVRYMNEITRIWEEKDFSEKNFEKYQSIILSEDLTSPINEIQV